MTQYYVTQVCIKYAMYNNASHYSLCGGSVCIIRTEPKRMADTVQALSASV